MFGFPGECSTCPLRSFNAPVILVKCGMKRRLRPKNDRTSMMVCGIGQPDMVCVFSEDGTTPLQQYFKPQ